MEEKKRILFVGDQIGTSGLQYVLCNFMMKFYESQNYEVAYCIATGGEVIQETFILNGKKFADYFKNK